MKQLGFKITRGHGFHITFKNNVTVSVQFGWANYCKNHDLDTDEEAVLIQREQMESPDAEIAIMDENGDWLTSKWSKGDDVKGYIEPEEVLKALIWAEKYKKKAI